MPWYGVSFITPEIIQRSGISHQRFLSYNPLFLCLLLCFFLTFGFSRAFHFSAVLKIARISFQIADHSAESGAAFASLFLLLFVHFDISFPCLLQSCLLCRISGKCQQFFCTYLSTITKKELFLLSEFFLASGASAVAKDIHPCQISVALIHSSRDRIS